MMTRSTFAAVGASALVALAGVLPAALAQDARDPVRKTQPGQPATDRDDARGQRQLISPRFGLWSKLKGTNIYNNNDESLGSITDAIVGRSNGRIDQLSLKSGAVLGIGGRTVLVPYRELRWDTANERWRLNATPEEVKRWPEFSAETWWRTEPGREPRPATEGWRTSAEMLARQAALDQVDPYQGRYNATAERIRLTGDITAVERRFIPGYGEYVFVTVRGADGSPMSVAIGPAWYLSDQDAYPIRGGQFSGTIARVGEPPQRDPARERPRDRAGQPEYIAVDAKIDGRDVRVRGSDLAPAWGRPDTATQHGPVRSRFLLASEVVGKEVDCRGVKCGDVDNLVVEFESGRVAFLSIDPDENFLGIGDTTRMVPWSIVNVRLDGRISVDATKDMVLNATPTPSDFEDTATRDLIAKVYSAYQIRPEDYMSDPYRDHMRDRDDKHKDHDQPRRDKK